MVTLIETFIYLLAIMGLIFTSISFIEMCNYKNYNCYKIFNKNREKDKRIEVVINMENIDEEEENDILDKLLNGEYNNLEEVVDCVRVEKDN